MHVDSCRHGIGIGDKRLPLKLWLVPWIHLEVSDSMTIRRLDIGDVKSRHSAERNHNNMDPWCVCVDEQTLLFEVNVIECRSQTTNHRREEILRLTIKAELQTVGGERVPIQARLATE